jgi:hypothetical protein
MLALKPSVEGSDNFFQNAVAHKKNAGQCKIYDQCDTAFDMPTKRESVPL